MDPTVGREQSGRRPVVVVSSPGYLDVVDTLAIVIPVTSINRGWPNHVAITGIDDVPPCWAMTEQPRTVSRSRLGGVIGRIDDECLGQILTWVTDFLAP